MWSPSIGVAGPVPSASGAAQLGSGAQWGGPDGSIGSSAVPVPCRIVADLSQAIEWHRQVAAIVAAADRAGVATADLPGVRTRLLMQQSRLTEEAARTGAPLPRLVPSPSEIAAVGPALGDLSEAAIVRTVRTMLSTLEAVDATLGSAAPVAATGSPAGAATADPIRAQPSAIPSATPTTPGTNAWTLRPTGPGPKIRDAARVSVGLRNAAVYGAYAATVFAVQVILFMVLDETRTLPTAAPLCLLVLPAFAWAAGFLTIGAVFRPPDRGKLNRTPRLGVVVCLIPDMLMCAAIGVLFAADVVSR